MTVEIKQVDSHLPVAALQALLERSLSEEFYMVENLINDWQSGTNRFDKQGEAFFIASVKDRAVGAGGRNIDPYLNDKSVLRVRRIYVLPEFRRQGVGRKLMEKIMDVPPSIKSLTLHTEKAAHFYESLGFSPISDPNSTHRLSLNKGARSHAR